MPCHIPFGNVPDPPGDAAGVPFLQVHQAHLPCGSRPHNVCMTAVDAYAKKFRLLLAGFARLVEDCGPQAKNAEAMFLVEGPRCAVGDLGPVGPHRFFLALALVSGNPKTQVLVVYEPWDPAACTILELADSADLPAPLTLRVAQRMSSATGVDAIIDCCSSDALALRLCKLDAQSWVATQLEYEVPRDPRQVVIKGKGNRRMLWTPSMRVPEPSTRERNRTDLDDLPKGNPLAPERSAVSRGAAKSGANHRGADSSSSTRRPVEAMPGALADNAVDEQPFSLEAELEELLGDFIGDEVSADAEIAEVCW